MLLLDPNMATIRSTADGYFCRAAGFFACEVFV
jgi:hypothetical protein